MNLAKLAIATIALAVFSFTNPSSAAGTTSTKAAKVQTGIKKQNLSRFDTLKKSEAFKAAIRSLSEKKTRKAAGALSRSNCQGESDEECEENTEWDYYYFEDGDVEVAFEKLPDVEITGERSVIICLDGDCFGYEGLEFVEEDIFDGRDEDLWEEILEELLPTPKISACGIGAHLSNGRNTTSTMGDSARKIAANEILNFNIQGPFYRIGMHGRDIEVKFSDGGTETYKFNAFTSSQVPAVPSDLTLGDGVSKCPVPAGD